MQHSVTYFEAVWHFALCRFSVACKTLPAFTSLKFSLRGVGLKLNFFGRFQTEFFQLPQIKMQIICPCREKKKKKKEKKKKRKEKEEKKKEKREKEKKWREEERKRRGGKEEKKKGKEKSKTRVDLFFVNWKTKFKKSWKQILYLNSRVLLVLSRSPLHPVENW